VYVFIKRRRHAPRTIATTATISNTTSSGKKVEGELFPDALFVSVVCDEPFVWVTPRFEQTTVGVAIASTFLLAAQLNRDTGKGSTIASTGCVVAGFLFSNLLGPGRIRGDIEKQGCE
jgi:hypothetical protein